MFYALLIFYRGAGGAEGRNKAYKIISLLYDSYKDDKQFQYYANSILTKLGNFASLSLAVKNTVAVDTLEIALEKEVKMTYQKFHLMIWYLQIHSINCLRP